MKRQLLLLVGLLLLSTPQASAATYIIEHRNISMSYISTNGTSNGTGITNISGVTNQSQTLEFNLYPISTGYSGFPSWEHNETSGQHILKIGLLPNEVDTAGLLSSNDYNTFNNKVSSQWTSFGTTFPRGIYYQDSGVNQVFMGDSFDISNTTQLNNFATAISAPLVVYYDGFGGSKKPHTNGGYLGFGYPLSVQKAGIDAYMEIANWNGENQGVFFGNYDKNFELWSYAGGPIIFYTSPYPSDGYERLRITQNGSLVIGLGSSYDTLPGWLIGGNARMTAGMYTTLFNATNATVGNLSVVGNDNVIIGSTAAAGTSAQIRYAGFGRAQSGYDGTDAFLASDDTTKGVSLKPSKITTFYINGTGSIGIGTGNKIPPLTDKRVTINGSVNITSTIGTAELCLNGLCYSSLSPDNASFNKTYTDTLYYPITTNPLSYYNSSSPPPLDVIANPGASKIFTMANKNLTFLYTAPTDNAFEIEATGGFSGDLLHVHQHTGNPPAGTDLVHIESNDADVLPLNITTPAGRDVAMATTGNITINGNKVLTRESDPLWSGNQSLYYLQSNPLSYLNKTTISTTQCTTVNCTVTVTAGARLTVWLKGTANFTIGPNVIKLTRNGTQLDTVIAQAPATATQIPFALMDYNDSMTAGTWDFSVQKTNASSNIGRLKTIIRVET